MSSSLGQWQYKGAAAGRACRAPSRSDLQLSSPQKASNLQCLFWQPTAVTAPQHLDLIPSAFLSYLLGARGGRSHLLGRRGRLFGGRSSVARAECGAKAWWAGARLGGGAHALALAADPDYPKNILQSFSIMARALRAALKILCNVDPGLTNPCLLIWGCSPP